MKIKLFYYLYYHITILFYFNVIYFIVYRFIFLFSFDFCTGIQSETFHTADTKADVTFADVRATFSVGVAPRVSIYRRASR